MHCFGIAGLRTTPEKASTSTVSVDARNHDPVVKRPKLHMNPPKYPFWLSFPTKSRGSLSYKTIPLPCKWSVFGTLQGRLPIPIDRAQQMIARNVLFERELIEQRSPFDLPMSHQFGPLAETESVRVISRNSALVSRPASERAWPPASDIART